MFILKQIYLTILSLGQRKNKATAPLVLYSKIKVWISSIQRTISCQRIFLQFELVPGPERRVPLIGESETDDFCKALWINKSIAPSFLYSKIKVWISSIQSTISRQRILQFELVPGSERKVRLIGECETDDYCLKG